MKIPSYNLLVRIAETRFIQNVTQAGPDWDLISFAVANVIQKRTLSMIKSKVPGQLEIIEKKW
jgi:hypothetical protein